MLLRLCALVFSFILKENRVSLFVIKERLMLVNGEYHRTA